jgi:lysine 6-dehydrogenase
LIIPGCGVAPGVSNMCIGRGAELLDEARTGVIYVGGIPKKKAPPLFYQTVYLMESVLNAYGRDATIVVNKEEAKVPPLSGLETISFPEPIGNLEAFYTDGLASLAITMKDRFEEKLFEKTLRYPGHAERVQLLKACGLLGEKPIEVGKVSVSPREVLLKALEEDLRLGPEGDILAMRIIVEGTKNGKPKKHTFELIDYMDPETKYTAMARTTGYPATCAARMITSGELTEKGVLFPEQVFLGQRFEKLVAALAAKGVKVTHQEEP